jgi:predicted porin
MKAPAFALAWMCAIGPDAFARSSVTLFGVVDLGVRYVDNDTFGSNESSTQLASNGMATSSLGVRGVEDLGGGTTASFWLEAGFAPDTGTGTSRYGYGESPNESLAFNLRSTVSLSNRWGELRLGRDYTPTFWSVTAFDPFGTSGVGSAGNLFLGADLRSVTNPGETFGTLVRANNTVGYILPRGQFGPGLYGQLMVAAGEGAPLNKYWGGRIGYAAGPFDVAASYGRTGVDVADTLDMSNWNAAGSWSFGAFGKISAYYGQIEVDVPSGGRADQKNWYLGYAIPVGVWNFKLSYGDVRQGGIPSLSGNRARQVALGVVYNLSMRTALYATASTLSNEGGATFLVAPSSVTPSPGLSSFGTEVGVRLMF